MRRFQFRLQALLDVAQQKERSIQQELARAQGKEAEARQRLDGTLRLWTEWEAKLRQNQQGRLDPHLLRELLGAVETVREKAARERAAVHAAEKAAEEVRGRLTEAAQQRKSLERLREKLHEQHTADSQKQQTKLFDDMAAVRAMARLAHDKTTAMTGVPA